MRLVGFKALTRGALRGFATIELPNGLVIEECPVLVSSNGPWAALPSKPVLDREGRQARPDGKPQYSTILRWRDRALQNQWSAAVVALVQRHYPDALSPAVAA